MLKISEINENADIKLLIYSLISVDVETLKSNLQNFNVYAEEFLLISSEKRKIEFLSVRIALNELFSKDVQVIYSASGKPCLLDNETCISVSHSKDYIAVMKHNQKSVGVDIEQTSDMERFRKVASKFLSIQELNNLSFDLYPEILPIAWSVKEAIYKMLEEETLHFSENIQILPFIPENEGIVKVLLPVRKRMLEVNYKKNNKFTLAYCIDIY